MNEWCFITATPDGRIVSMDGAVFDGNNTIQGFCQVTNWEIEHAAFDSVSGDEPAYWRLILSRPYTLSTRTPSEPAAFVGVAGGGL